MAIYHKHLVWRWLIADMVSSGSRKFKTQNISGSFLILPLNIDRAIVKAIHNRTC